MHVTGLHTCDFLETVFKEYKTEEEYKEDGTFNKTKDGKPKGIIVCFHDGNKPIYRYAPWNCNETVFEQWYDDLLDNESTLTWIQNTYWRLEKKIFGRLLKKKGFRDILIENLKKERKNLLSYRRW
jgi:hypothetical protein